MDRRILGKILILNFLVLLGSGFLLYFKPFAKHVASTHTFFGFMFILALGFHFFNNKNSLSMYLAKMGKTRFQKLESPLILSILGLMLFGLYFGLPVMHGIYDFGNKLRNSQLGKEESFLDYEIISLKEVQGRQKIEIELKKGPAFQYPLFAIWIEDSTGNYIETVYISRVISSSTYDFGEQVHGAWTPQIKRRPEALPYWSHKRGVKAADGLYVPLNNSMDIDGVSGATPTGNFILKTNSKIQDLKNYRILMEVNQSYDWNDYYSEEQFPQDQVYSGSGQVGQPSLIYSSTLPEKKSDTQSYQIMKLIGHGHHSGKDGRLFRDLSKVTTAKQIVDRAIVHLLE